MTIVYRIENSLYINLTNQCPCSCTFCLRQSKDRMGDMGSEESLWLESEPTADEIKRALSQQPLETFDQIVFCGFGEPTERLECLVETAGYIKRHCHTAVRLNTNGLSDLINQKQTAPLLCGLIDTISISLNAGNAEDYLRVTRSKFGLASYDAMLRFAVECKQQGIDTVLSVVDIIGEEEVAACRARCDALGLPLRVRAYEE